MLHPTLSPAKLSPDSCLLAIGWRAISANQLLDYNSKWRHKTENREIDEGVEIETMSLELVHSDVGVFRSIQNSLAIYELCPPWSYPTFQPDLPSLIHYKSSYSEKRKPAERLTLNDQRVSCEKKVVGRSTIE